MTWKLARQNLALLDHFFWLRSSRTDRYRFLKTYLQNRSERPPEVRRLRPADRGIDASLGRAALAAMGTAVPVDEQILRSLSPAPPPGAWHRATCDPAEIQPLLDDPDLPFRRPTTTILKDSRTTTVAETTMVVRRPPDPGHLQAVQPQEMARSAPEPVPAVACMAVMASRPASRQPRDPDAAEPGVHLAAPSVQSGPAVLVPAA